MAEAHPVGFQWVMEAKARGAKIIHVDPRFTRTSAVADLHVPFRAGADIAFLGGLINYVLTEGKDFREYVTTFTNAADLGTKHAVFAEIANARRISPQVLTLAWELHASELVIPIPGSTRPQTIMNSATAATIKLSADEVQRLDAAADAVAQMAREAVLARMPAWLPRSWSTQLADRVAQAAGLEVRRRFPELAEGLLAAAGEGLRLGSVVERKLLELDPAGVEALVVRLAGRELRFVEWSGAVLGFLVGLLQALLVSL